jgi:hypothetical protein
MGTGPRVPHIPDFLWNFVGSVHIMCLGNPESASHVKDYLRKCASINDAKMPSTPLLQDHLL